MVKESLELEIKLPGGAVRLDPRSVGAPGIEVGQGDDRPRLTWDDFGQLLQGILTPAEEGSVRLSATAFHSAVGQIWDKLAPLAAELDARGLGVEELRRIVARVSSRPPEGAGG